MWGRGPVPPVPQSDRRRPEVHEGQEGDEKVSQRL